MRIRGAHGESLNIKAIKWAADEADRAVAWQKAQNPNLTPQQIEAYEAGFREGFRKGVGTVILQEDL